METIQLYDMVALTTALPEYGLRRGEVGVVIDLGPNNQYLLEFADRNGVSYAMPTVLGDHLLKVFLHADMVE